MVSPVAWFNNIFLKKYNEDTDFVLYKKAQFIASLSSALALIMVLLLGVSLSTSREVFLTAYKPASTLILILIMAITLVVKGRVLWSANLIAVASLLIEIFAFTSRPPHLATVTIGLFFLPDCSLCNAVLQGVHIHPHTGGNCYHTHLLLRYGRVKDSAGPGTGRRQDGCNRWIYYTYNRISNMPGIVAISA